MKLIRVILGLLMVGPMTAAAANDDPRDLIHRYKLVKSKSAAMCQHMAGVYREKFKHPWHHESKSSADGAKYFGMLPHELFKALDGVPQTPSDSFYLLLNKRPTSAEFDAVPWLEGRMKINSYYSPALTPRREFAPILISNIDVDNDGRGEYFVKLVSLASQPRNGVFGWGAAPIDVIRIYDLEVLKNADLSKFEPGNYQENAALSEMFRTDANTTFIRPLRYQGRWYFHAYHTKWPAAKTSHGLPGKEGVEIFKVDKAGDGAYRKTSICDFEVLAIKKG